MLLAVGPRPSPACAWGSVEVVRMGEKQREEVLQTVLDKLWSSALEFAEDKNEHGNPTEAARKRWQEYVEQLLLRWLEYHSPSAADRSGIQRRRI